MQPEISGFVPAVFLQDRIGRGYGLGGQRVQVYIIVIGVEIPRCIAVQFRQAGGVGQGNGGTLGQRFQRRDAEPLKHGRVQK